MEERNKHIDDLFREELSGYREAPPPPVWDALERRLDDDDRRRRALPFWSRWGLALLLLCLATTGYVAYHHFSNDAAAADSPSLSYNASAPAAVSPAEEASPASHPTSDVLPAHTASTISNSVHHKSSDNHTAPDKAIAIAEPNNQPESGNNPGKQRPAGNSAPATGNTDAPAATSIVATATTPVKTLPDKEQADETIASSQAINKDNQVAARTELQKDQKSKQSNKTALQTKDSTVVIAKGKSTITAQTATTAGGNTTAVAAATLPQPVILQSGTITSRKGKENEGNREIRYQQPSTGANTLPATRAENIAGLKGRKALLDNTLMPQAIAMAKTIDLPQSSIPVQTAKTRRRRHTADQPVIAAAALPQAELSAGASSDTKQEATSIPDTATAPLSATPPPPTKKRREWNLPVDLGVKGGYERSPGSTLAQGLFIAPYVQWKASENLSLIFQPGFRMNRIAQPMQLLDETAFHQVTMQHATLQNADDSFSVSGPAYYRRYFYKEEYDSIIISALIRQQNYMEIELPVMMQYKISKQFSVFGGLSLTLGKLLKVDEVRKEYQGFLKSGRFVSLVDSTGNPVQMPPDNKTYFSYSTPDISTYASGDYSNPPINPVRMGYSLGASYSPNGRLMFEASMRQNLSDMKFIQNDQLRKIYTQPYFRVTVGYKIFVAKERK